jgi:hypothetical protein
VKDIRLSTSFWDHWKTVILKSELGYPAVESLQRLWCFAAINKPDGKLTGMTIRTIEIASHWPGQTGELVSKLVELCFLETVEGVFVLHDWADHNGWVVHAKERSEQGKKGAAARWAKKNNPQAPDPSGKNADSNARSNADSNAPGNAPTPTPTPTPNLKDMILTDHGDSGESPPAPSAKVVNIDSTPYADILTLYHQTLPDLRAVRKLTPARKNAIRAAWRGEMLGPKLPAWRQFFEYIRDDCPFLSGQKPDKDGRAFHADLEWLMKPANLVKVVEGKYEEEVRRG